MIFDGYLICSDFDGTFFCSGGRISEENCRAVRYFQDNGGRFTIATGRSPEFVAGFPQFQCNAPVIACNGTMICDAETGKRLWEATLPESAGAMMDEMSRCPWAQRIYLCDAYGQGNEWTPEMGPPSAHFAKIPRPWYKVLFHQAIEDTPRLQAYAQEHFGGEYAVDRSYPMGVELHILGSGKGECLAQMRRLLPEVRVIVGVGDYENDVTLIRMADVGYAVDNAVPEAKAVADRITVKNDEHAIARIIEALEKEIREGGTDK